MKRGARVALLLALLLTLSGCQDTFLPKAQDITYVELMRTIAVERGENGLLSVTASGAVRRQDEGSSQPPMVLSAEGLTMAAACLTIRTAGNSNVCYGHVKECLIGETLAAEGIQPVVDDLERDYETQLSTKLFLVSGLTPAELIQQATTEESAVTDRLEAIARDLPLKSEAWPYTLKHLLSDLKDNGAALMPVVTLNQEGETPEIVLEGLGWFRQGTYQGMLDHALSQGACLLTGNAENGMLEVALPNGASAAVRLSKAQCETSPTWQGDKLTGLKLTLTLEGELANLQGTTLGEGGTSFDQLEAAVSYYLEETGGEVIALSQQEETDFLHLRRQVGLKSAAHKGALEAGWEDWFPTLPIQVEAQVTIRRSGSMVQT
jgi:spore germination protein KC